MFYRLLLFSFEQHGERGIRTLAPLLTTYSLSRGAPSASLGTSPSVRISFIHIQIHNVNCERREWDSNPRALADKRFSRPPRYDHFDTPARERVMGIEPTYPAWKAGVLPLNYTRIFNCSQVGVTGFEPATSWSQTRRSSQAEPHPDMLFCRFVFVASPKRLRYNITLFHTCQHFFTFFLN